MCFARSKDICRFPVNHVVACEELFFAHAEGHPEDVFDEAQDGRGPDDVPADDEECAYDSVTVLVSGWDVEGREKRTVARPAFHCLQSHRPGWQVQMLRTLQ